MKTMMKWIAALLIAAMMMTGAALASGKIRTDGNVNVRKGAGLNYASKGTVSAGKVLSFDETRKDERGVIWYHVTNGKGGWISSKYTTQVSGSVSGEKVTAENATRVKATGNVNVRKGPGLKYGVLGSAKAGQTAKFMGETRKDDRGVVWYKVGGNGKTGWVSSKYAKLMK